MKNPLLSTVTSALLLFGVGCAGSAQYSATATVDTPQLILIEPEVQVVADYDEPIFYTDNYYWRYDGGAWYRSNNHVRGWVRYEAPARLRKIDRRERYVRYHGEVRDHRDHQPPPAAPPPTTVYNPPPPPPPHPHADRKEVREDLKDARKEAKQDAKDVRQDAKEERKEAKAEVKADRKDDRHDAKEERRDPNTTAKDFRQDAKEERKEAKADAKADRKDDRHDAKEERKEAKQDMKDAKKKNK